MTETNRPHDTEPSIRQQAEEKLKAVTADPVPPAVLPSSPGELQELIHDLQVHRIELEMQNEELRRTHQQLEESRARYFELYDLAPVGYLTLDGQGRIRESNLAAAALLGEERSNLTTRPLAQFIFHEDQDVYYLFRKRISETGRPAGCELRLDRADGSSLWTRLQASVDRGNGSRITLLDISDSKKAEEEKLEAVRKLMQSRKMESLGVLVGGIAHDFNNILAIIIGYCSLARLRPATAEKHLEKIEMAAGRAAELCRLMLTYAGKSRPEMAPVDVSALTAEMVSMLKSSMRQTVTISTDIPGGGLFIRGDASQIRQIVMNLVINAAEAIVDAQGDIRVRLVKTALPSGHTLRDHLGNDIPPGRYVCLEVTDNGCGMDDETRQHIFDPFFTTKFSGSGLGLSATLGIITAHGGALQCHSQAGSGTTFRVYLPEFSGDEAGAEIRPPCDGTWTGSGTVLLVEDEEQIRHTTREMLTELGFSVIEAANGWEAVEACRENPGGIDLVVTDIGMPVMDGYAACQKLKELRPGLPIVITSGFGDAVVTERIEEGVIAGLLSKPYGFDELRDTLKRVVQKTFHRC